MRNCLARNGGCVVSGGWPCVQRYRA